MCPQTMQTNNRAAVEQAIRMAELPRYVVDRRYQLDLDLAGEEAVSIWLIVTDGKRLKAPEIYENRDAIHSALSEAGLSLWPFVYYRTVSEQRSCDRADRREGRPRLGRAGTGAGSPRTRIAAGLAPLQHPVVMRSTKPMTESRTAAEQAVWMAKLPRYVVDRRWELDLDLAGEEAISIWLIVTDGKRLRAPEIYKNRAAIRSALSAADLSLWPFVYYRTVSEQRSFDRADNVHEPRPRRAGKASAHRKRWAHRRAGPRRIVSANLPGLAPLQHPAGMRSTRPRKTNSRTAAEQAIRMAELPRYVVDRRYEMDIDPVGEEAVSIWLIVTDGKRLRAREIYKNQDTIRAALEQAGLSLWPFVYYRTVSEQRSFDRSRSRA